MKPNATPDWLPPGDRVRTLLQMQHHALLMYTSCGWFFDDISGLEAVQVLKYAGRVLDFMDELGLPSARARFLDLLDEAKSNRGGTGAEIYRRFVEDGEPLGAPPPRPEADLERRLSDALEQGRAAGDFGGALKVAEEVLARRAALDWTEPNRIFSEILRHATEEALEGGSVRTVEQLLEWKGRLGLNPNLEAAQDVVYDALKAGRKSSRLQRLTEVVGFAPSLIERFFPAVPA
jgi:hypothetical protein